MLVFVGILIVVVIVAMFYAIHCKNGHLICHNNGTSVPNTPHTLNNDQGASGSAYAIEMQTVKNYHKQGQGHSIKKTTTSFINTGSQTSPGLNLENRVGPSVTGSRSNQHIISDKSVVPPENFNNPLNDLNKPYKHQEAEADDQSITSSIDTGAATWSRVNSVRSHHTETPGTAEQLPSYGSEEHQFDIAETYSHQPKAVQDDQRQMSFTLEGSYIERPGDHIHGDEEAEAKDTVESLIESTPLIQTRDVTKKEDLQKSFDIREIKEDDEEYDLASKSKSFFISLLFKSNTGTNGWKIILFNQD